MDNLMGVHVVTCANELDHEKAGLWFSESATAAQHVHERTRGAELERHVDIVGIFEALLEVDYVGVSERPVDPDFCAKLAIKEH
jgi:hypothetical protein